MTVFYVPNSDDKEVFIFGNSCHTSIRTIFTCDGEDCKNKNLFVKKDLALCGGKHYCLECAKIFCKKNKILITTEDVKKIGKAIRKKIPFERNQHNPFRHKTLVRLESYLTKTKLMKGIKYRTLKQDLFPKTAYGTMWREKIVKYFNLVEDKSKGYTVLYSKEGYENFNKSQNAINEAVEIVKV